MNFKEATDTLFGRIDHSALAKALGVSVASIRQARLSHSAKAYRDSPKDWQYAVIRLAEQQIMRYRQLIEQVRKEALPK
jgi:hypothetical protein